VKNDESWEEKWWKRENEKNLGKSFKKQLKHLNLGLKGGLKPQDVCDAIEKA
jgi:hypothetical protein